VIRMGDLVDRPPLTGIPWAHATGVVLAPITSGWENDLYGRKLCELMLVKGDHIYTTYLFTGEFSRVELPGDPR